MAKSAGGIKLTWKKTGKKLSWRKIMINYQCSFNLRIFPLFLVNFFPMFPFNCQLSIFLHNFMQNSKKIRRFAPFAALFVQFCFRNGEIFERCHEDFYRCPQEKTGKKLTFFVWGGRKNWNFWPKYLPLRHKGIIIKFWKKILFDLKVLTVMMYFGKLCEKSICSLYFTI